MPPLDPNELNEAVAGGSNPNAVPEDDKDLDFGDELSTPAEPERAPEEPGDGSEAAAGEEPQGAGETEPASEGEDEGELGEEEAPKTHFVPKTRLDQALARARAAEEALTKQRETAPKGEERDLNQELTDLNDKFAQALLDGDKAAATALNQQIMRLGQDQLRQEIAQNSAQSVFTAQDAVATDTLVEDLVSNFPQFDPSEDNEQFDQELVDDIEELRDAFYNRGYSKSEALAKAVKMRFPEAMQSPAKAATPDLATRGLKEKIDKASRAAPDIAGVGEDGAALGQTRAGQPPKTIDDWMEVEDNDPRWSQWLGDEG